jgi:hypothetical protein
MIQFVAITQDSPIEVGNFNQIVKLLTSLLVIVTNTCIFS